ncbi:hypothetical protein [Methanogenium sp. MK-MG]|uniref:hypothetical protein n=1 Tax=Methanogenium sp. MK-MG TaxID=2599926 RepID=UPI0013EA0B53|nr:hypothetical protein [Methanogenium sp. MK-MG]KAF1073398.1 hypothetical protein MKMG_02171 [Methanogenium sp. MK-MG]
MKEKLIFLILIFIFLSGVISGCIENNNQDTEKSPSDNQTVNESELNPLTQNETEMLDKMLWVPEIIFDSNTSDSVINATVDKYFGENIPKKIRDEPLYVNSYLKSDKDLFEGYKVDLQDDSLVEIGNPASPWVYTIVESEKVIDGDIILATHISGENISEELNRIRDYGIPIKRTKSVTISTPSAADNSDSKMTAAVDECNRDNTVLFVLKLYLKC